MKIISKNKEETKKIAKEFLSTLKVNSNGATIIGLKGDLGSGKTTFAQYVAEILKVKDIITSPTFVIEKIYVVDNNVRGFERLIHIDAYRLESGEDLNKIGWEEIIKDPKNLILIEWPENVEEVLPNPTKIINFKFIDETTREIEF